MNPYQIGAWAGVSLTNLITGTVQGISEGLDFANLLTQSNSATAAATPPNEASQFEGLNDRHREMAEQRIRLRGALDSLSEQLAGWAGNTNLEISRGLSGDWQVSGDPALRAQLEQVIAQDPQWQESWNELQSAISQLQSLGVEDFDGVPIDDQRLSSQKVAWPEANGSSSFELGLRRRDSQVVAVLQ